MSTPEQMIEAQRCVLLWAQVAMSDATHKHLLTPDALAALLRERDQLADEVVKANGLLDMQMEERALLQQQRDQWRECAEALVQTYNDGVIYEHSAALARFDRLKAQEAGK
jgi:hypothetical protein